MLLLAIVEGYDDFNNLTVGTLKDFLSLRGLSTTGRKIELVARAFSAYELKLPVKLTAQELNTKIQNQYQERLQKHGLVDPQNTESWIDDVTKWPTIDLGKIFSYILAKKEFHYEYIGKYKDQKAYSYWMSNFVGTIWFSGNNGKYVVKCLVTPSQHVRDDPKEVWVAMEKDGSILCGWCTCIAGTSATCNHMIAVLYKLEYASKACYNDPACTSTPCGWNTSTRKDVQPGRIMEMTIRKDKKTKDTTKQPGIILDSWKQFDPRRDGQNIVTEQQKELFLNGNRQIQPDLMINETSRV